MIKHKYVFKIDKVCKRCGYRNKLQAVFSDDLNVIACGNCGELLSIPSGMDKKEQEAIKDLISNALSKVQKGDLDALL